MASYDAKITKSEHIVSSLAARVSTLETNATSVCLQWFRLGKLLELTGTWKLAPQPQGPMGPWTRVVRRQQEHKTWTWYLFQPGGRTCTKCRFAWISMWTISRGSICLDRQFLGYGKRASSQQTSQNTLWNRLHVCQTLIRNKSQMSVLCGPISGWRNLLWNWQHQNNYRGPPVQVFWRPETRSIPSYHAAVRVTFHKPTLQVHGKRIPSWMSKHPVFCSILKRLDYDRQYLADPFGAPMTAWEPNCWPPRPRYELTEIDTSARWCDVVKRGNLWESALIQPPSSASTSTELARSFRASRVKTSLNEKQIKETSPGQTEGDSALAKCRLGLRAWRAKKPMLCFHAVTCDDGRHPLENEDESGRRLCEYWSTIFQARVKGQWHHH